MSDSHRSQAHSRKIKALAAYYYAEGCIHADQQVKFCAFISPEKQGDRVSASTRKALLPKCRSWMRRLCDEGRLDEVIYIADAIGTALPVRALQRSADRLLARGSIERLSFVYRRIGNWKKYLDVLRLTLDRGNVTAAASGLRNERHLVGDPELGSPYRALCQRVAEAVLATCQPDRAADLFLLAGDLIPTARLLSVGLALLDTMSPGAISVLEAVAQRDATQIPERTRKRLIDQVALLRTWESPRETCGSVAARAYVLAGESQRLPELFATQLEQRDFAGAAATSKATGDPAHRRTFIAVISEVFTSGLTARELKKASSAFHWLGWASIPHPLLESYVTACCRERKPELAIPALEALRDYDRLVHFGMECIAEHEFSARRAFEIAAQLRA